MNLRFTKFQIALEIVGFLLMIGMIIFVGIRWNQLPQQIPGHFNSMGEVDRWGSKNEILMMPAVGFLLYLGLTVVSFFPMLWNVPVKITEANKEAVYSSTRSLLIFANIEVIGIFFYITYFMATTQALPVAFLPAFLLILFGTMIFFTIRIIRKGKMK